MKNLSTILSLLAIAGVLSLGGIMVMQKNKTVVKEAPVAVSGGAMIAYVDIDTLEAKYDLLKKRGEDFKKKQAQMEAELQRSYAQMQNDAYEMQKKAQSNSLTQAEYESANKKLMQMQQTLESRKQSLTEQLMKEQEEFNSDLKKRLNSYLAEYNKTHKFDFILSYSGSGSAILYAGKAHNITDDVVQGLNEAANAEAEKK
jgi:outer membrane protein